MKGLKVTSPPTIIMSYGKIKCSQAKEIFLHGKVQEKNPAAGSPGSLSPSESFPVPKLCFTVGLGGIGLSVQLPKG